MLGEAERVRNRLFWPKFSAWKGQGRAVEGVELRPLGVGGDVLVVHTPQEHLFGVVVQV